MRRRTARLLRTTRYGIKVDPADSLLRQGADGLALTWMDARLDGKPVTQRAGKAVEINALWINALATVATLEERIKHDASGLRRLAQLARESFKHHFLSPSGCADVIDPDSIRLILDHRADRPVPVFSLDGRPHLASVQVPVTDVAAYGVLLAGEGSR